MSLGVTQMACCPFQYLTMFSAWSVLTMSSCAMLEQVDAREEEQRDKLGDLGEGGDDKLLAFVGLERVEQHPVVG